MIKILKYDSITDIFSYKCHCGKENHVDCSAFVSTFNEELGDFENLVAPCECGMVNIFSMTIPIGEYEELDIEYRIMPFAEINTRKYLRDFIWAKREDLIGINREQYNLAELRAIQ